MIAGLVAGLLYAVFAYAIGEPPLDAAIAVEEQHAAAPAEAGHGEAAHSHGEAAPAEGGGEELVSRGVQSTLGLLTAALVYGVAIGGIFALVFAVAQGRVGRMTPRATAAVLALVGYVVIYVVPFLKYPANPPASSAAATIGQRTGLYLVMVLFSVLAATGAAVLRQRLASRHGAWNATLLAAAAYLVLISAIGYAMPTINETPADFPAPVLYDFRVASLGGQLVLWAALGLTFGALVQRNAKAHATA
jgi:predicted cobalt transporter CbtA